eukprot:NODE_375_length_9841_cov_0.151098.p5 type:complete len:185 gc:universal NODE_375_length_9841_cov_0.151098:7049-7603(+)
MLFTTFLSALPSDASNQSDNSVVTSDSKATFETSALTQALFYTYDNKDENDGYTNQFACGGSAPKDDLYAALPMALFKNSICGSTVTVTYETKNVSVVILDSCSTCKDSEIDLSKKAWLTLYSDELKGVLDVSVSLGSAPGNSTANYKDGSNDSGSTNNSTISGTDETKTHNIEKSDCDKGDQK